VIEFSLPLPPLALSQCFVNSKRGRRSIRIASYDYKAWKQQIDLHIKMKVTHAFFERHRASLEGDVRVTFNIERVDRRRRDLDNTLKCLGDTLTRNGILRDDSQIVDLRVRWVKKGQGAPVRIEIAPAIE